jgi:cytochrome c-type biogenesis protein CcmH/NrfG
MNLTSITSRAAAAHALAVLLALASLSAGCGRGRRGDATSATPQPSAAQANANAPATAADAAKLDAEIDRLERQAERNPGDEDTGDELARAYVRRGDLRRGAGQLKEAVADYQQALRFDPDNAEAQTAAAAAKEQLGGEQEDENGAPAPLPITPNVADEDGKPAGSPSPTPKKP